MNEGSRIVYITEKVAHQHAQKGNFLAIRRSLIVEVDRLVSYPPVFIHL